MGCDYYKCDYCDEVYDEYREDPVEGLEINCHHNLCYNCLQTSWDTYGRRGTDDPEWDQDCNYLDECIVCNATKCQECGHILMG